MTPMPPNCAMAIAISASVTVSMAAEMMGIESGIVRVMRVAVETSAGSTEDAPGFIGRLGTTLAVKAGERILIDAFDVPDEMVVALIRAARARGAHPYVQLHRARITRELSFGAEEAQFAPHAEVELARMQKMDAYIALRGSENIFEASDIPAERVQLVSRLMKPVLDHRVGKTKWVVLRWPTPSMANPALVGPRSEVRPTAMLNTL